MKKLASFIFVLTSALSSPGFSEDSSPSGSNPSSSTSVKKSLVANWFQVTGGAIFDSDGGFSGVTGLSWIPTLLLSGNWRLRVSLGAMLANLGAGNGFFVGDGNLMLLYTEAKPLTLEVGGGGQYWDGRRNFHPQVRAGLGYRLPSSGLGFLHAVHLYYTHIFTPVVTSHQVMAGFSIRL